VLDRQPTRILVLAANPRGTEQLRLDQEVREIQDGLERARTPFTVRQYWATRPSDLSREILRFRPQLVHFCGHGREEGLVLEDETGTPKLITPDALAGFFELFADSIKCVILNCCYSRFQAQAIAAHIPFVVGMKGQIGDDAAIVFSIAFYEALGEERDVDFAFLYALSRIRLEGLPDSGVPEAFSKTQQNKTLSQPTSLPDPPASQDSSPLARNAESPWPTSLEELSELSWKEFEIFSLRVVGEIYRGSNLNFSHTRFSQDEGRDGEAQYVVGLDLESEWHITFRIWLEVKQRKQRNVDKSDVASHLIDALIGKVNKVILVTNRSFAGSIRVWLSEFSARTGLQYQLIDGSALLGHARTVRSLSNSTQQATATALDSLSTPPSIDLTLKYWFSLSPYEQRPESFRQTSITPRPDRPVYLIVDARFSDHFQVSRIEVVVKSPVESGLTFYPWTPPSQTVSKLASASEQLRQIFVAWPGTVADRTLSDLDVDVTSDRPLKTEKYLLNSIKLSQSVLSDVDLHDQSRVRTTVISILDRWRSRGEFFSALISAPPGLGKSRIVASIRKHCHLEGVSEVFLDCESVTTDVDFVRHLLRILLPFPRAFLDSDLIESMSQWCMGIGISRDTAVQVAQELCGGGREGSSIGPSCRVDIATAILSSNFRMQPVALIIEDLHKAAPSLLAFLSSLISRLASSGDSSVLLIASTRPFYSGTPSLRAEWLAALSSISLADRCIVLELEPPPSRDARRLLQASILALEENHADIIIAAVGTSPFSLREAILFLLSTKCLELSEYDRRQTITVVNPAGLRLALASEELSRSTEQRIKLLLENQPSWLQLLLLAGAAFGRRFPLDVILEALQIRDDLALDYSLEMCSAWSIATLSSGAGEWLEFDHDLVREAILLLGPTRSRRRVAKAVLDALGSGAQPEIQTRLAYQAGLPDVCLAAVKTAKDKAKSEGRVADLIEFNQLAMQVLDPDVAAGVLSELLKTGEQHLLDPAMRNLDSCTSIASSPDDRRKSVLGLLLENVECLNTVGSGSSGAVEATITEARLIAERIEDRNCIAQLLYFEGRMWFERNSVEKAVALHEQAEILFSRQECLRNSARAENLVRQAICLRKSGRAKDSVAHLWKAAQQRPPGDWLLLNKVRNNLGAAFLRTDWLKVRYHWEKQIQQADRRKLLARKVHGLASLSFIDLFEGRLNEGLAKVREGLELAERLRLDNQVVRLCLNLAIHSLITGNTGEAQVFLLKAEQLALRHGIGRRLWRIAANLATAYEILGSTDRAFSRDLQVIRQLEDSFSAEGPGGREILPLVNVLLRVQIDTRFEPLLDRIPAGCIATAKNYAGLVLAAHCDGLPGLLGNYCINLPVGPRFLLSE
jgi:tetratricopeptide (TPR) repeat protein